jgi:glycolate oxidase FAD binding subunit
LNAPATAAATAATAPTAPVDATVAPFVERVQAARAARTALRIRGGGTKDFHAHRLEGEIVDTTPLAGIVDHDPSELVLTARAGTPLAQVEAALAATNQCLAFEPPRFGHGGTLGGAIASGLSGPRRASTGSARDYVLGIRMIDGRGQHLRFGGRVMKNVAGYDVSRVLAASWGTLGLLTEVSLKVLPRPEHTVSLRFEIAETEAITSLNRHAGQPLPIAASAWHDGVLTLRLSGAASAVDAARAKLGGDPLAPTDADAFWIGLRDHALPWFRDGFVDGGRALWRLSLASTAPPLGLGPTWIEWGGAQRWIAGDVAADTVHTAAARHGGHATLWGGGDRGAGIQRVAPGVLALSRRLKSAFDPEGVFGPHRLFAEF